MPHPILVLLLYAAPASLIISLLFAHLRVVKFREAPDRRQPTFGDALSSMALGGISGAAAGWYFLATSPLAAVGAGIVLTAIALLLLVVWLDAGLYHLFSFELGVGGIGGAVFSNLYREVASLHITTEFFRRHPSYFFVPICLIAYVVALMQAPTSATYSGIMVFFLLYFFWIRIEIGVTAGSALSIAMFALLVPLFIVPAGSSFVATAPGIGLVLGATMIGVFSPGLRAQRIDRTSLVLELFRARYLVVPPDFEVLPEHGSFFREPAMPTPSPLHGILRGRSIVIFSFESLSSYHVETIEAGTARMPFFGSFWANSVRSPYHLCTAPLTNCAHHAWYYSRDTDDGKSNLAAFSAAGYRTTYLTPVVTAHYGLAELLARAGFATVVDGSQLTPHALDRSVVSDYALLNHNFGWIGEGSSPFLLHIHSSNLHVPYRLMDADRFHHFSAVDDRARFLNAVEETDWIFSQLWLRILEQCIEPPLLVMTSDHGQAFGELGYWTHATGLVRETITVPLLMHHLELAAQTIENSTHFDLFPTLMDLVGLEEYPAGFGTSLFHSPRMDAHLLWDGKPSRSSCNCLGIVLGNKKVTADLVRRTCTAADMDDRSIRSLEPVERAYLEALMESLARFRGVSSN